MKKPNKKTQESRRRNAEKRAARKRSRLGNKKQNLNRRNNIIEAKKQNLFDKWVSAVNSYFEKSK